jgi:hypothetical protein
VRSQFWVIRVGPAMFARSPVLLQLWTCWGVVRTAAMGQ